MENITEKEFSKLKRRDLLELLLSQIQEDDRLERKGNVMATRIVKQEKSLVHLKQRLDEKDAQIGKLKERLDEKDAQIGRLKERLDEKDAQLEKLKRRLDEKDKRLKEMEETLQEERESRRIDLEKAGSIADAALRLSGIFEAAQDAANRYLENLQTLSEKKESQEAMDATEQFPEASSELVKSAEGPEQFPEASKELTELAVPAPEANHLPEKAEEQAEPERIPGELQKEGISQEVGADGDS